MMPRSARRLGAILLGAVFVVAALTALPGAAVATFASQCGAPTRSPAPGSGSLSVAAGETVLLAGGAFTGGIDALPAGATVCVGAGATLSPGYMNNAAGTIVVASGANLAMPSIAVSTGFDLELEGAATFAGLNINGSSELRVASTGSLTINSGFSPATGSIDNAGTMHVAGGMNLNTSAQLSNTGQLVVDQSATINGVLANSGTALFGGSLTVNGSGAFANKCALSIAGSLSNNGPNSTNGGLVLVAGGFTNNGTWRQTPAGALAATTLTDDGAVSGFGQYQFSGFTSVQNSFVGDSASAPIVADTVAPAGVIFNVQTGTIANVVRAGVSVGTLGSYPAPDCASPRPSADVIVNKTGPATAIEGTSVSYSVGVANAGPGSATAVVVTDGLPVGLIGVTADSGGIVAGSTVTWSVGTIAAAGTATLTVTGTVAAAAGTTLTDVASSTSTSPDPNPENNDGSSDAAQVNTLVVPAAPANNPPVADDLTIDGTTGQSLLGAVTANDPDVEQKLTFTTVTAPAHGRFELFPGGGFAYLSAADFTGIDTAQFQVCDNGTPVLCDTGTIQLRIFPIVTDDVAQTFVNHAVDVPILANDVSPGAVLDPTPVTVPTNGTVSIDATTGIATYTPSTGFVGTDSFAYRTCSPTAPTLCTGATVTVTVLPANDPPVIQPFHLVTVTGIPIDHTVVVSDPNGNGVTVTLGAAAQFGTATLLPASGNRYSPGSGYAGTDTYTLIACDNGTPTLCSTGVATVDVFPIARDDAATTTDGTPVTVAVGANDEGTVADPVVTAAPAHGSVTVTGAQIVYTPDAGFDGQDQFSYQICATGAPTLCAAAVVTVTVDAPPTPINPDDPLAATGVDGGGPALAALLLLGAGVAMSGGAAIRSRRFYGAARRLRAARWLRARGGL